MEAIEELWAKDRSFFSWRIHDWEWAWKPRHGDLLVAKSVSRDSFADSGNASITASGISVDEVIGERQPPGAASMVYSFLFRPVP